MGILDDQPYVPTDPDAIALVEDLRALFAEEATRELARVSRIPSDQINWNRAIAFVWPEVVEVAARLGRLRTLAMCAFKMAPASPLLKRLLEEPPVSVTAVAAARPADPWNTPRLWRAEAMIGRGDLRSKVQKMLDPNSERALYIVGEKETGKSNSRRFMSYLAESKALPRIRIIDNSLRAGEPMGVQELAQLVASTVAGEKAPSFDLVAQPTSVVTQFRGWLSGVTAGLDDPVWLVFDGFTSENTAEAGLQLINDLAASVADYQLSPLRVAVCGFAGPTPAYPGALHEPLEHPTADDVKTFFKRMSELLAVAPSEDEAIDVMFEEFVRRGGAVEARPLAELGPSALEFANRVYGAEP